MTAEERAMTTTQQVYGETYGGTGPENYQRYFVPAIGRPVADDLIEVAGLQPGERVLDVACGTGVVTRLAAERVGPRGSVAGLDVNPSMLAVARAETRAGCGSHHWYEASAEAMPLPDGAYDVVLCQMGLQFIPNKLAALRDMRRVLAPGGRIHLNVPGPKPPLFEVMREAVGRHLGAEAAGFTDLVFSLHDVGDLHDLMERAGFDDIDVHRRTMSLTLPPPSDFLWQYVYSTPMAGAAAAAGQQTLAALENDVTRGWKPFVTSAGMALEVGMTIGTAHK
jgi:ubiquinone/menaquinone biosynthesis C-methylase UbiE